MGTYSLYYMKAEFFRKGVMGYDWLRGKSLLPDSADLSKTHVRLKLIEARNPEDAYFKMQGESWSPTGDAREFVASKGVQHTSMSVGDIVVDHNSRVALSSIGWGLGFSGR